MSRNLQWATWPSIAAVVAFVALAIAPLSSAPAPAYAGQAENAVLDWNLHAVTALINPAAQPLPPSPPIQFLGAGQTPPVASLHLAMVQGAVYDAVNAIHRGYEPYLSGLPRVSSSASKTAAVATAAHHVLVGLVVPGSSPPAPLLPQVTRTWLDEAYAASLAGIPESRRKDREAKAAGIAAGVAAAQAMLEERASDGRYGSFRFTVGDERGEWQPTSGINDPFAWVARVEPFLLERASQLRTKGPKALESSAYAREYNEVKALGGNGTTTPSDRTDEQTAIAVFFTANPVEMFNRAFRGIAEHRRLKLVDEARLFAMLNLAGADGLISCWDDKAFWSFWRPLTAIQQGDDDGNGETDGDSGWTPFAANPPYPDHPSGYNCLTGSFMHTAGVFFGRNRMAFSISRVSPDGTRNYERFTDVIEDTIDARVYQGIHFRSADEQGARIGEKVARWLDKHYFERVDRKHEEKDDDD